MTTQVDKAIEVAVPVRTAYNQWTQFEEFPQFMGGVHEVRQLGDRQLHWVAEIAGVRREWDAEIIEQVPDEKVAWAATEGATNAGAVFFSALGPGRTSVRLHLEYAPEGVVERVGDKLNIVEKQAESDLRSSSPTSRAEVWRAAPGAGRWTATSALRTSKRPRRPGATAARPASHRRQWLPERRRRPPVSPRRAPCGARTTRTTLRTSA